MLARIIAGSVIVGALGATLIMQFTTPATIHPFGLLVFFLCLYVVALGLMTYVLYAGASIYGRVRPRGVVPVERLRLPKAYEYASIISLAPVILLAMQTVGGIQLLDVVFVGLFVAIGCFYIAKRG